MEREDTRCIRTKSKQSAGSEENIWEWGRWPCVRLWKPRGTDFRRPPYHREPWKVQSEERPWCKSPRTQDQKHQARSQQRFCLALEQHWNLFPESVYILNHHYFRKKRLRWPLNSGRREDILLSATYLHLQLPNWPTTVWWGVSTLTKQLRWRKNQFKPPNSHSLRRYSKDLLWGLTYFFCHLPERWRHRVGAIVSDCKSELLIRVKQSYSDRKHIGEEFRDVSTGFWPQWRKQKVIVSHVKEPWMQAVHDKHGDPAVSSGTYPASGFHFPHV